MTNFSIAAAIGLLLFLTCGAAYPQEIIGRRFIQPYPLGITYFKTSNLVFPYAIVSVDRGSKDVLVQQAKGVENILHVKAGKENFEETNLTVITADGLMYSYVLHYTERPTQLNIKYASQTTVRPEGIFPKGTHNEAEMRSDAKVILHKKVTIGVKDRKYGMQLRLNGIFIRDGVLYFKIALGNSTNINYDIEQFRFFITDQKKSRRTASQELELEPLYTFQGTTTIVGQKEHVMVCALSKFTIPDEKLLVIQLMEKDGGRHLELKVPNRIIVKAKSIAD